MARAPACTALCDSRPCRPTPRAQGCRGAPCIRWATCPPSNSSARWPAPRPSGWQQRRRRRGPPPRAQQQQQQQQQPQQQQAGSGARHDDLVTFEEVQRIAATRGLEISVGALGPFYRIVCRDAAAPAPAPAGRRRRAPSSAERAAEEAAAGVGGAGRVLAVTSGFVAPPPLALMHCDSLQVFTAGQRGEEGARTRGGVLGLGLLLGAATFAWGLARRCTKAEILAINDDDAWHERLVRYYSRFGFRPVRVVGGGGLADLPHLLVWGGAGTRMDADLEGALRRWTPALRANTAGARAAPAPAPRDA